MATTKTAKQVQVIATYYHKKDGKLTGVVSYLVRASNGIDTYCTTLIEGKASGCSCPSRSPRGCYHKNQLEQKAQERKEVAQHFAAKSVPTWFIQLVSVGKLIAPKQVVQLPAGVTPVNGTLRVKGPVIARETTDISTKGTLTRNAGFSILKIA